MSSLSANDAETRKPRKEYLLSIVTGTLNRRHALAAMIESVRADIPKCNYEFVIADAGSEDGTQDWCQKQFDVVLIEQGRRLGAVKGYNRAFRKARGRYVCALNDDCVLKGDVLKTAIRQLKDDPLIGQVAIPFKDPQGEIHYDHIGLGKPIKDYRYANFGVTQRWLGELVGWWGDYYHYAGDTSLSLSIIAAGYQVADLASKGYIEHRRIEDETRVYENQDSKFFFDKWRTFQGPPDKPILFPPKDV